MISPDVYGNAATGGVAAMGGLPLNCPAWMVLDWHPVVHSLGLAVRGANGVVDGEPGTRAYGKFPTESTFSLKLAVVGDCDFEGTVIDNPLIGFDANMAALNTIFAPITTPPYTQALRVQDVTGTYWDVDVQTQWLQAAESLGTGYDNNGLWTKMGIFPFELVVPAGEVIAEA